jgi:hypothetical protein
MNIVFGYGSDSQLNNASLAEARDVVLDLHSKDYVTDTAMDPTLLIKGDKFGVGPANTTLTVTYRVNTSENSNAAANAVNTVASTTFEFATLLQLQQFEALWRLQTKSPSRATLRHHPSQN